ncbi:MAG: hypothetical protein JW795_17100 [Chitinivibrionales bacterium]|nr:hypothetical protein [Chitinivibrionales bacterium]
MEKKKTGRPSNFQEETVTVGCRIPRSWFDRLPKPYTKWLIEAILNHIQKTLPFRRKNND